MKAIFPQFLFGLFNSTKGALVSSLFHSSSTCTHGLMSQTCCQKQNTKLAFVPGLIFMETSCDTVFKSITI